MVSVITEEVIYMFKIADSKEIGNYLHKLIEKTYPSVRQFCQAYLRLQCIEVTDEETRKVQNRFSQIINDKKAIQVYDLPIVCELLGVTCEEILSAGTHTVPQYDRITNYYIAQSKDREVWDRYIKREDRLFLNCDEYRKTVIDYALEFGNYEFMKYLLDEKYIWFVDLSKEGYGLHYEKYYYGVGTSIESNLQRFRYADSSLVCELYEKDDLRTQTIALAIKNNDCEILDSLLARLIPEMYYIDRFGGQKRYDFNARRNDTLIEAIALTDNEKILDYFSDEFIIEQVHGYEIPVMFPFLDNLIEVMLNNGKEENAKIFLRKAIKHSKETFKELDLYINESCKTEYKRIQEQKEELFILAFKNGVNIEDTNITKSEEELKKSVASRLDYDQKNNVVSFCGEPHLFISTNIFYIKSEKGSAHIRELVNELNDWFNKILALGGDKNAQILL